MLGFPYSITSLVCRRTSLLTKAHIVQRQQTGRAGRRSRDSLSILIAQNVPLDQHYVANADELWDQEPEDLVVDLDNRITLEGEIYKHPLNVA